MADMIWQQVGVFWSEHPVKGSGYIDLGLMGRISVIIRSNGEVSKSGMIKNNLICDLNALPIVPSKWVRQEKYTPPEEVFPLHKKTEASKTRAGDDHDEPF